MRPAQDCALRAPPGAASSLQGPIFTTPLDVTGNIASLNRFHSHFSADHPDQSLHTESLSLASYSTSNPNARGRRDINPIRYSIQRATAQLFYTVMTTNFPIAVLSKQTIGRIFADPFFKPIHHIEFKSVQPYSMDKIFFIDLRPIEIERRRFFIDVQHFSTKKFRDFF